jgi:hypothetical protein
MSRLRLSRPIISVRQHDEVACDRSADRPMEIPPARRASSIATFLRPGRASTVTG